MNDTKQKKLKKLDIVQAIRSADIGGRPDGKPDGVTTLEEYQYSNVGIVATDQAELHAKSLLDKHLANPTENLTPEKLKGAVIGTLGTLVGELSAIVQKLEIYPNKDEVFDLPASNKPLNMTVEAMTKFHKDYQTGVERVLDQFEGMPLKELQTKINKARDRIDLYMDPRADTAQRLPMIKSDPSKYIDPRGK